MDDKPRCQSCGMPLGAPGYFGTEVDGAENKEFCVYCYRDGGYTESSLTLQEMIEKSVEFMTANLDFTEEKARELSTTVIPGLKRWKK